MALRMGALHDALRQAHGVSEEAAKAAAEELASNASYMPRVTSEMQKIRTEFTRVKWLVVATLALSVGALVLTWALIERLPPSAH